MQLVRHITVTIFPRNSGNIQIISLKVNEILISGYIDEGT
jgi:hypothetical protein